MRALSHTTAPLRIALVLLAVRTIMAAFANAGFNEDFGQSLFEKAANVYAEDHTLILGEDGRDTDCLGAPLSPRDD